jgi:hypothetical protein
MDAEDLIFISYAREDRSWAERLYMDLRKQELNVWLDSKCLKAGANWKHEIPRAIRKARFFLLLISKHSVNKRGYVQKEIKEGLDVLEEFPTGSIFIIPARLDETEPVDRELHELNWVSLLPDYHDGLARILSTFSGLVRKPLKYPNDAAPTVPVEFIDKGASVIVNLPMILGDRSSISYAPFRSAKEYLRQFFDRLPTDAKFFDTSFSYYVTIDTQHPRVILGEDLLRQYPESILLVFQNVFRELTVREEGFSVILSFGGKKREVAVAFEAIRQIDIPEIGLHISIDRPVSFP